MAKTNFSYEKRQRELEKKRKAEEKAARKAAAKNDKDPAEPDPSISNAENPELQSDG